jgi:spermidine/putrescine transport system substrate-binding protein
MRKLLVLVFLISAFGCTSPQETVAPTETLTVVIATEEATEAASEAETEATVEATTEAETTDDVAAEETAEPTEEAGEEATVEATEATEDTTAATEEATEESGEEPTAEATEATEDTTAATTEEATEEAGEEVTDEATAATEDTSAATEEATEVASDDTAATAEGTEDATEGSTETTESGADTFVDTEWTCPEGFEGQTLSLFNWATYIGDNTVSDFEKLCGVTVQYDVYESDEALIARLRQGNPGYDLAFPTDYAVAIMARDGLVGEIDLANIPNIANIDERYLEPYFDPENAYTVPYVWGTTGIGYNIDATGEDIETWEQVFEYDGRVAWVDSSRPMLGAALSVLGLDPNTTNPEDIDAAKQYLIDHASNVIAIASDDGDALLAQGEVDIAVEYGGDVFQQIAECDCENLKYAVPLRGGILDLTSILILGDGPNPELAQVFMDYLLDPDVHAHVINTIYYPSPNRVAMEEGLIDEAFLSNPAGNPPEEALANMFYIMDVGEEAEQLYNDAWDEVKILAGS